VELPIPIGRSGYVVNFSGIVRPRHHHDELEFNLGVSGWARFSIGARQGELRPGSLIWFLPGHDHVLEAATPDFQMWIVAFKPRLVEAYLERGRDRRLPHLAEPVRTFTKQEYASLIDRCRTSFGGPCDRVRDEHLVGLLDLALAHDGCRRDEPRRDVHPAVERSLRWLANDPSLGRGDLARRAGIGPEALSRKFFESVGTSIPEFKNRLRLGRFLRVLEGGETNLLRAAIEAGFGSYPQFHHVVREQTGVVPSVFARPEARQLVWSTSPNPPSP